MSIFQASGLVDRILQGDVDWISHQDKALLLENKDVITKRLVSIFSDEIPRLLEEGICLDSNTLYLGFELAKLLEASDTFKWILQLCYVPTEIMGEYFDTYFVTDDLGSLLANTMSQWKKLTSIIEDPSIDDDIRGVCLEALVIGVAKGKIPREEIVDYFKTLFKRAIEGDFAESDFSTNLVAACVDFWPGECLEEIRELFGLSLVDESFVDLPEVIEANEDGKDACMKMIMDIEEISSLWGENEEDLQDLDEECFEELEEDIDLEEIEEDPTCERNDICLCGSGKKYKKCCINKTSKVDVPETVRIEEVTISYEPLETIEKREDIPEAEKESIKDVFFLIHEDPEKALTSATRYIKKYPDIPFLYNYLYAAYRVLGRPQEAMDVLKKTLKKFPHYFFGRVEYAQYFLRRGEPEKVMEIFNNAKTLTQLYPDRKVFHVTEWKSFCYVMGLYYIQKGDIKQAKMYRDMILKVAPSCEEVKDLEKKMRAYSFQ